MLIAFFGFLLWFAEYKRYCFRCHFGYIFRFLGNVSTSLTNLSCKFKYLCPCLAISFYVNVLLLSNIEMYVIRIADKPSDNVVLTSYTYWHFDLTRFYHLSACFFEFIQRIIPLLMRQHHFHIP